MRVRFAAAQDARQLAELRWLSRPASEQERQPLASFRAEFERWFLAALDSGRWYVAVSEGGSGLAGCMYLHTVQKVPVPGGGPGHWGYVTHAFVREEARNHGAGTALLQLLVLRARELDLELLQVWPSAAALRFYERAGFLSPERQRSALPDDEPSLILPL